VVKLIVRYCLVNKIRFFVNWYLIKLGFFGDLSPKWYNNWRAHLFAWLQMSLGAVHLAGEVCMPCALCPEVEDLTQEPKRG
jgi:hypothetical protein